MAKRFLTLALAALMIMSMLVTGASAGTFTDVPASNEALTEAVDLLATLGITKGTTATTFGTDENVTRQQMAAFIYRLMKAGRSVEGGENLTNFADLNDSTFYFMVSWAADQGIIKGTSKTTFNPLGGIKLQDAYTMLVRALGYEKDETLPYPIGYIDIAEQIGLSENIPSTVDYSDELTRGDVAILLYNAFYAEMNEDITVDNYVDLNGTLVNFPKTVKATVATKIFKVTEETWQVVATPNYALDNNNVTKADLNDIDLVVLTNGTDTETVVFSTLGLDGEADDYFLSKLTLFTRNDKVVAAKSNLVTATGKIEFGRVAEKNVKVEDQKLSGYFTVGALKGYFYDAPKSFNAAKAEVIGLTGGASTESFLWETGKLDNGTTIAFTNDVKADANYNLAKNTFNADFYEATAYDVDGNGTVDYLWYKPYTFGQVIVDTTKNAADEYVNTFVAKHTGANVDKTVTVDNVPSIYTQSAVMVGTASDEAWALAYLNARANYIAVGAVVKAVEGKVKMVASDKTVTLLTGEKFATDDTFTPGQEGVFYIYEGKLLYDTVKTTAEAEMDYTAPVAFLLNAATEKINATFDVATGAVIEGSNYLKAYIDGAVKYVKVAAKDEEGNAIELATVEALKGNLVFYTVNAKGEYLFTALDPANKYADSSVLALGAETGEGKIYAAVKAGPSDITKVLGNIYKFSENIIPCQYAAIASDAKVIIKTLDEENNDVFTVYAADDVPAFANQFTNIQYVLVNNTASTSIESLVLLYAEAAEVTLTTDAVPELRIVGGSYTMWDEEKEATVNYYTLLNPLTGEIAKDVLGTKEGAAVADFSVYKVADVLKDNVAADANLATNNDLVVISSYDAALSLVEINNNFYKIDDKTVITVLDRDAEEVSFTKVTADALNPAVETYQQSDEKLYAYINSSEVEGTNNFYKHLDFAVIVIGAAANLQ